MNKFPPNIIKELGYYVYLYIDPRNKEVFYVGKGIGNRCFSHLKDTKDSEKVARIQDILDSGLKPQIEILVHGLDEPTSLRVEASVIDLIDVNKLTNMVKGHSSSKIGRMSIEKICSLYSPVKADIKEPSLLIKISRTFHYNTSPQELYDATRQFWRLSKDREKAKYAFAVFDGVIQEAYSIASWHEAGTSFSTRPYIEEKHKGRWEFIGNVATEKHIREYVYQDVSHITNQQASVYYQNIKGVKVDE